MTTLRLAEELLLKKIVQEEGNGAIKKSVGSK